MTNVNNAVEIHELTKMYGGNKAVDNISFSVKRGEIMGFLGPNGAGKSTTMNIICGCISASMGSVSVCGCDVLENPKIVKSKIGYLPENPPLYFDMTVIEYLNFVFELKKVKLNRKEHLEKIMELVRITDMKNRLIKNLSKGYKQRVGMAQALIGDPEVLILDEPTVGLDPKQIVEIRNVIKEIGKERTIILSTHILQEVSAVCDRVTIISHGKVVAQDTLDGLVESMGGKDEFVLRVSGNANAVLNSVSGVVTFKKLESKEKDAYEYLVMQKEGMDMREELSKKLCESGLYIMELRSSVPSLEEMFIRLTSAPVEEEQSEEIVQAPEDDADCDIEEADNDDGNI